MTTVAPIRQEVRRRRSRRSRLQFSRRRQGEPRCGRRWGQGVCTLLARDRPAQPFEPLAHGGGHRGRQALAGLGRKFADEPISRCVLDVERHEKEEYELFSSLNDCVAGQQKTPRLRGFSTSG
jgi:hypothetical protein